MSLRNIPLRLATGAYILHAGLQKLHADDEHATAIHGMASGAYPFLKELPAPAFVRGLATSEVALGCALLLPFVPRRLAGAALTAFAGGLIGMYLRTPAMHEPDSVWPTSAGIAVSKDVWMLGIGLALLVEP